MLRLAVFQWHKIVPELIGMVLAMSILSDHGEFYDIIVSKIIIKQNCGMLTNK